MAAQAPGTGGSLSEGLDLYGRPPWSRLAGLPWLGPVPRRRLLLVAAPLISVLWGVIGRALPVWHWSVLTEPTTATGGGLANEILGTLVIVAGVGILAGLVGILSGIYLAEYAKGHVRRRFSGGFGSPRRDPVDRARLRGLYSSRDRPALAVLPRLPP